MALDLTTDTWSLRVIGGHPSIHDQFVQVSNSSDLVVRSHHSLSSDYLAQQKDLKDNKDRHSVPKPFDPAVLMFAEDGEVISVLSEDSNKDYLPSSSVLALQGPSGKGEYQLVRLDNSDLVPGLGSSTDYTAWSIEEGSESARSRLNYAGITEQGHWIAVPANGADNLSGNEIDDWQLWWYSPSGANMEDFPVYVMVDLEPVPAATAMGDSV